MTLVLFIMMLNLMEASRLWAGNDWDCNKAVKTSLFGDCSQIALSKDCGKKPSPVAGDRNFGGTKQDPQKWPWFVSLLISRGKNRFICGGSMIDESWVVTAYHCVNGATSIIVELIDNYAQITRIPASKYVPHPNSRDNLVWHDLALVQLSKPFHKSKVRPICMTCGGELFSDAELDKNQYTCWVVGRGQNNDSQNSYPHLYGIRVHPFSNKRSCRFVSNGYDKYCDGMLLCTKGSDQSGICQGDSGGPLMCEGTDRRWYLVGVVNFIFGGMVQEKCRTMKQGYYLDLRSYHDWILATVRDLPVRENSAPDSRMAGQERWVVLLSGTVILLFNNLKLN